MDKILVPLYTMQNSNLPFTLIVCSTLRQRPSRSSSIQPFTVALIWFWFSMIEIDPRNQGRSISPGWSIQRPLDHRSKNTKDKMRSSSSYSRYHRWGYGSSGGGKRYFIIPFIFELLAPRTHVVMSTSVAGTPNRAEKKLSSTAFKHKHGGAVRRIVYFQPQEVERSLQGNVSVTSILRVFFFVDSCINNYTISLSS